METSQGFSVSYNQKFLYSKYAPSKQIIQTIEKTELLEETLILAFSPILLYGLQNLIEKIPENCFILCIELDESLYNFSNDLYKNDYLSSQYEDLCKSNKITFLTIKEAYNLPFILNQKSYVFSDGHKLPQAGSFKRIVSIDFSAGTQFQADLYKTLSQSSTNAIMTFWKNRITLMKFGHSYSKNFFKNLLQSYDCLSINTFLRKITKPILVFGAGESINIQFEQIKSFRNAFFIICVDTSFTTLLHNNIVPDAVFVEETQSVILKAFIGENYFTSNYNNNNTPVIFAGLSSINQLGHNISHDKLSYFTTLYTQADFITNLQKLNLLPFANPPFGSVGLTAVYYALHFRINDSIPIFVFGLDFSYSAGNTHGKETMAHLSRLEATNRLNPVQNYSAAFSYPALPISDKYGKITYTTPLLQSYRESFINLFSGIKNLFDAGTKGLSLNLSLCNPFDLFSEADLHNYTKMIFTSEQSTRENLYLQIKAYVHSEAQSLNELKALLTGEKKLPETERNKQIQQLAEPREYLYLHFPEGWKFSMDISFLKRIRAEIDVFLKIFNSSS